MNPHYSIRIDFQKQSKNPERVFETMVGLIKSFEEFDRNLAKIISIDFEPEILLQDITTGSLRAKIANYLKTIDDSAIKELNWKKMVGSYLVKAKYKLIDFLEKGDTVTDIKQVEQLNDNFVQLAKEIDIIYLPSYSPIPTQKLLENIKDVGEAVSNLKSTDKATLEVESKQIEINKNFRLPSQGIEQLLTERVIVNKRELTLKVKKPDFLGLSKWEMKHGNKAIMVKISDEKWLRQFHKQEVSLLPGDSIKGLVKISESIDQYGEIVTEEYSFERIDEILKKSSYQINLF